MADIVSPAIVIKEISLDQVVPPVSTTTGGFAGVFSWGPVAERRLVNSEADLVSTFGRPSDLNGETWLAVSSFLSYGAPCWVVRAANTTTSNGSVGVLTALANTANVANVLAQVTTNDVSYASKDGTYDTNVLWIARYPGAIGNSLRVSSVFTANAYTSNLALSTFGNSGATFSINVGSNAATVTLTASSVTTANANGQALAALITVTDVLSIGNTTIGKQTMKVSGALTVNAQGNTTVGNCTITIPLEDPLSLHSDFSTTSDVVRYWEFAGLVGTPPGQSAYVAAHGNTSANDEMHVVVVDEGGKFTGVPGQVLEVYRGLSRATDAKGLDNGSIYYKTVINQQSQYLRWANDDTGALSANAASVASSTVLDPVNLRLNSGADGADESNTSVAVLAAGWDLFDSKDDVDVSLLFVGKGLGGVDSTQLCNYIVDNIAETRKDCVVYASPDPSVVVNNKGEELNGLLTWNDSLRDSSYLFPDTGYKQMYDRYNDVYRWVPLNGDNAGLTARTDYTNDPWWAPAGINRGILKNVVKLAYSPPLADRDVLYPLGINPVFSMKGIGPVLYGNRTHLGTISAFQDLNIRRLFIYLEKGVTKMAESFMFEFNDSFTRARFRNTVIPYLRDVQGRRGIRDFRVRCDETNNTDQVIRQDRFVGDIIVLPNRAIAGIQLNFVAVGTSVTFSEIQGVQF